jgi:hypothetical protein
VKWPGWVENGINIGPFQPLYPEDKGSMDLRNFGILPQHYTASHTRRHPLEMGQRRYNFKVSTTFKNIVTICHEAQMETINRRVYPKVSRLAAWSENC